MRSLGDLTPSPVAGGDSNLEPGGRTSGAAGSEPTVSIGLAVFNGERYLREAIDSILAQTFTDFELIISDNASTDGTAEICREYEKLDARIRYQRNNRNIGGANNENLTFRQSRGRYFRLAAHDDLLHPTLLERCVEVLDSHPDVVVCHPATVVIDEFGRETARHRRARPSGLSKAQMFASLTYINECEETYGLMRSSALAATGLQRNYTDSDRTLLAHLALLGRYVELDEYLFYKRVHPGMSTQIYSDWRSRMQWFGEDYSAKISLPHWQQFAHYLEIIWSSPVDLSTKIRCYGHMLIWPTRYRRWRSLGKDLLLAAVAFSRPKRR